MLFYGLIALVAIAILMILMAARMRSHDAAQMLRWVLGLGGIGLGVLLTARGLAIAGLPLIGAAIGLLGVAMRGGKHKQKNRSEHATPPASARAQMSRKEACEILGVDEAATEAEIQSAYRAMMKRVHPDAGGSDALAAKVYDARETLLGGSA